MRLCACSIQKEGPVGTTILKLILYDNVWHLRVTQLGVSQYMKKWVGWPICFFFAQCVCVYRDVGWGRYQTVYVCMERLERRGEREQEWGCEGEWGTVLTYDIISYLSYLHLLWYMWQTHVSTSGVVAHACKIWHVFSFDGRDEKLGMISSWLQWALTCGHLALGMIEGNDFRLPPLHCIVGSFFFQ